MLSTSNLIKSGRIHDIEEGTVFMIRSPQSAFSAKKPVQGAILSGQTRVAGHYHLLVEQGFLRQEELATAMAEALRKRIDVVTVLMCDDDGVNIADIDVDGFQA